MGCGVDCFTAKVIDAIGDTGPINAASYQLIQAAFDAVEEQYTEEIVATCIYSLDDGDDGPDDTDRFGY